MPDEVRRALGLKDRKADGKKTPDNDSQPMEGQPK